MKSGVSDPSYPPGLDFFNSRARRSGQKEEKLTLGKLKAEIRKTENWKPASEGKSGLEKNQPRNHK